MVDYDTMTDQPAFFLHVDPSADIPIYRQLVDAVARAIASGALGAGDPLPSVRELALDLRINLNTVSRAYRELQERGLAEMRRGVGIFVAASSLPASRQSRLALLDDSLDALVAEATQLGLDEAEVASRLGLRFRRRRSKRSKKP